MAAAAAACLLGIALAGCGSDDGPNGPDTPTASATASPSPTASDTTASNDSGSNDSGSNGSGSDGKAGSDNGGPDKTDKPADAGKVADAKALQQAVGKATKERKYVKIKVSNGTGTAITQAEYTDSGTNTHTKAGSTETITIGADAYVKSHGVWTKAMLPINQAGGIESKLAGQLRDLGREKVDGTQTTHYRTTADMDQLIAASDGDNKKLLQQAKKLGVSGYVTDLWISDDDLPIKAVVAVNGGPKIPTTTMRFTEWGKPFKIRAPKVG